VSVEELTEGAEVRTRRCRRCDVEINAASARCPYCGLRQFKRQPILGWRGAIVCILLVAGAVVATRAIVLASGGATRYTSYRDGNLAALVPWGYHDLNLAAPHGTALAGWADPVDPADSETVRASVPVGGTPQSRIDAQASTLRNVRGAAVGFRGTIVLPGGLAVPVVEWTRYGNSHAMVAFDACGRTIGLTVSMSASSRERLDQLLLALPQGANAICTGPAYSDRDRADAAIPLALPS
jgi:RNA polymerase subunit RPABC4/transcription elongation factor Spt4